MTSSLLHAILATSLVPFVLSNEPGKETVPEVNFIKLSRSPFYIDKTKLLREFFTSNSSRNFVTCPKRFGKTANLKMIKVFAEIELDKNKKPIHWDETYAYTVFRNLAVSKFPRIMSQHLGRYLIIHLNLNMDHIKRTSERKMLNYLNQQVNDNYEKYRWILKRHYEVERDDVEYMEKVRNGTLNTLEKYLCISRLAKILYNVFGGVKVIVLVDDYDSALTKATYEPEIPIEKYYLWLNNMLSRTFKTGSKYIERVLMTGTSSLSYYRDAAKLEGIKHLPFLEDHALVSFCGVLEKELAPVMEHLECSDVERFKIKECFDGYRTRSKRRSVYNLNSVKKYLESGARQISKYWQERHEGGNIYFPAIKEVPKFWQSANRDYMIFSFLCFYDFFTEISVSANTENREAFNFTLSKSYDSEAYSKFNILVKYVLNYLDYEPHFYKQRDAYTDIIRTYAFEQGYFTHLPRKGYYGVPNCEVRSTVVAMVSEHNAKPDPKFVDIT